jgi:tripartite-type tricarboxylate transporter receptor subunit TctC
MKLPRRNFLHLAAGAAALPAASRFAWAQTYPSRRITVVVPFSPGAVADVVARVVADGMQARLGQPVIIENAAGADGSIGTGRVARATPDGYTVIAGLWNTHVANSVIYPLQYDVVKDFEPIGLLAHAPMVLVVNKAIPADNFNEFIAWLKANPDKASLGTAGAGSSPHLLGLLLQKETGTQFKLVHYRGGTPAMQDIVAGHIDGMFISVTGALSQVASANVKALGVTAQKRSPAAPEIPTMGEAGLHEFYFSIWEGLFAPKGTPRASIDRLNAAVVNTLGDPSVRQKLEAQGYEIPPPEQQTPEALRAYQKAEIEKWSPIIKAAGIKAE